MIIEKVNIENEKQIKKIINLIYKTFCDCNKNDSSNKLIKKYEELYWKMYNYNETLKYFKKNSKIFIIAKDWDKVVWIIRWMKNKITNLYVDSNFHNKWIWKRLLKAFEKEAKSLWSNKIHLKSSKYALSFYIKHGFKTREDKYLEKTLD